MQSAGHEAFGRGRGKECAPIRFGTKRKMFSFGPEDPLVAAMGVCAPPFPFVRTFCSATGSGRVLVGVSSAAARAACRRVLAPDITTVRLCVLQWTIHCRMARLMDRVAG